MIIKEINLENFRNHKQRVIEFLPGITAIVGPNASGKTNLLESLVLLALGTSSRTQVGSEMIAHGQSLARVNCQVIDQEKMTLEVVLTTGEINQARVAKKRYLINGIAKRKMDFIGCLKAVYFGPQDLELILGSPSIRRNYLNSILEQVDRDYRRASLSYQKGLRQRNKLLEQIREEGKPRSMLFFWDKLLIENGQLMTQKREELIESINQSPYFKPVEVFYDKSVISIDRLKQYERQEVAAAATLVGPHRDDFQIFLNGKNQKRSLHSYGSRGEQRLAVFALKLAELDFITTRTETKPILLLDDIFSELDHQHRKQLFKIIPKHQTIITTSDIHLIEPEFRKKLTLVKFL